MLRPFPLVLWLKKDSNLVFEDWKLLACLPQVKDEDGVARQFIQMMRIKLKRGVDLRDPDLEGKVVSAAREEKDSLFRLAIREMDRDDLEEMTVSENARHKLLGGTSALLFIHIESEEELREAVSRLNLLLMHTTCRPPPPLLLLSTLPSEQAVESFCLDQHSSKGLISSYEVISISCDVFDIEQIVQITEGVANLVLRRPANPSAGLARKIFRDFVEDFLSREVEIVQSLSSCYWFLLLSGVCCLVCEPKDQAVARPGGSMS